jgi:long-chain acyl-CoA synthetase
MNIVTEIFRRADPAATALIENERTVTFGQLQAWCDHAAGQLTGWQGRRIGFYCPNGLPHIIWSLALLRAGAVLVPVAPELSGPEREQLLATTALHGILTAGGQSWPHPAGHVRTLALDDMQASLHTELPPYPTPLFDEAALSALNPALIRFSSGTTGKRKGVVIAHETLLARVTTANTGLQIGPSDRVVWMLPMAHHFAVSIILYLLHGATTVLIESHLGADVYAGLKKHGGTVLYAAPFHHALLAAVPDAAPIPSLRLAVSTAAALPEATAQAFQKTFHIPLRQALGIIECGLPILNTLWPEKTASIGTPQPGFEMQLRTPEGHPITLPGQVGELFLRGPGMVDAYLSPWTPRSSILEDGWFRTGDQARADADGALFLQGRTHSVINVGGMKCFPEEIEACLTQHPAVREARVLGIPHPGFGAVPAAEIVPTDPASPPRMGELMGHCRARLSGYKVPLKFLFVTALPKTPSGKLDRTAPLTAP